MIFLPMAISFAGAAITFRLIYSFRPEGFGSNIGLLNGDHARARPAPGRLAVASQPWNNLLLMVIMVWMQTGFAMVVLSAAIKADPRRDHRGRADRRRDRSSRSSAAIIVPTILPTIVGGEHVHGHQRAEGVRHRLRHGQRGDERHRGDRRADDPVVLHQARTTGAGPRSRSSCSSSSIPVMLWNVRRFREQEAVR